MGLINGRKFRHVKVMRPRFKAGSTTLTGSRTWALARFDCMISSRNPSGHCSASAASGAAMAVDSTGIEGAGAWATGAGAGMAAGIGAGIDAGIGAAGFGAPLVRGAATLATNLVSCDRVVSCEMDDGGGVTTAAGVTVRGTNAGGGGATGAGCAGAGATGATILKADGLDRWVKVVEGVGFVPVEIFTP